MTPFGRRLRELRTARGVTQADMAAALGVTAGYLSALENGHRGRASFALVQAVAQYFNVIWDEADELARLAAISRPRVTVETGGLVPEATELANLLAAHIHRLQPGEIEELLRTLRRHVREAERATGSETGGSEVEGSGAGDESRQ